MNQCFSYFEEMLYFCVPFENECFCVTIINSRESVVLFTGVNQCFLFFIITLNNLYVCYALKK